MSRIAPIILKAILSEQGVPVTRTRLMKLMFLLSKEDVIKESGYHFYEFLPYQYGPYSFSADRDILWMVNQKEILSDGTHYEVNKTGEYRNQIESLPINLRNKVQALVEHYREYRDGRLVKLVYQYFPSYTMLSQLVSNPPVRPVAKVANYTMGYEGTSIDGFLRALIFGGIQRVVDVRNNPISRCYGYSGKTFNTLCSRIGVDYLHLPQLGIPSSARKELEHPEDYQHLFQYYENKILKGNPSDIKEAAELVKEKPSVLVCFEKDPLFCHRSRLAKHLHRINTLPVIHMEASCAGGEKESTDYC